MSHQVAQTFAKAVGKMTGIEAHIKGLRGVFKTLAEQHAEVRALLGRAEAATEGDARYDLWQEARPRLLAHERAELAEVYPAIAECGATEQLAQRHALSASELQAVITRLDTIAPAHAAWLVELRSLIALVDEHVDAEETNYFPRAQAALGEAHVEALRARFVFAHEHALQQLTGE